MKVLISIITLLFFFGNPSEEKILWKQDRKLTWKDFKAPSTTHYEFVAVTSSGIWFNYSYAEHNGKITYDYSVQSYFYPQKSWYNPKEATPYILQHEQTHFDISELHARKLRKLISQLPPARNIKNQLNELYKKIEIQRKAMQERFDNETNHSVDVKAEKQWETYVAKQLEEYDAWQ